MPRLVERIKIYRVDGGIPDSQQRDDIPWITVPTRLVDVDDHWSTSHIRLSSMIPDGFALLARDCTNMPLSQRVAPR